MPILMHETPTNDDEEFGRFFSLDQQIGVQFPEYIVLTQEQFKKLLMEYRIYRSSEESNFVWFMSYGGKNKIEEVMKSATGGRDID